MTPRMDGCTSETSLRPSSLRKRSAILDAAEMIFLRDGCATANMDELADRSGVSKRTIYSHFGDKRSLFVEMATRMTGSAFHSVHPQIADPDDAAEMTDYLESYALRLLDSVLDPHLIALRRLVIGEATRFPGLSHRRYRSAGRVRCIALHLGRSSNRNYRPDCGRTCPPRGACGSGRRSAYP